MRGLFAELNARNLDLPVLIGGRLNQVPQGSNTSLPVDVSGELAEAGAIVCAHAEDAIPVLARIAEARTAKKNKR